MRYSVYKILFAIATLTMATTIFAAETERVEKIVNKVCSACHGIGGTTTSPNFPRLAGQQPVYMKAELTEFRDKSRKDADAEPMWGWTRALSDQDIVGIAAYYASQKPISGEPGAANLMRRGQEIFEAGISEKVPPCGLCHGSNAEGKDLAPRLASQNSHYLITQLNEAYRDTALRPDNGAMHFVVKGLSSDDILALATYLHSK